MGQDVLQDVADGHKCLEILLRREYLPSKIVEIAKLINHFDRLVEKIWNKLEHKHKVIGYYNLPEAARNAGEDFLAKKLLKIYSKFLTLTEIQYKCRITGTGEALNRRQYLELNLAIKIICFADYGFINNQRKREKKKNER